MNFGDVIDVDLDANLAVLMQMRDPPVQLPVQMMDLSVQMLGPPVQILWKTLGKSLEGVPGR